MTLLEVQGLGVSLKRAGRMVPVLEDVCLRVAPGEMLALVGESGCGKSTAALAMLRLLPAGAVARGSVLFRARDVMGLDLAGLRRLRGGGIGMVFQDALGALSPAMRVGAQIAEAFRLHQGGSAAVGMARAVALLDEVGLGDPSRCAGLYPHQLSGGMRQRALLAAALAGSPALLIADEPASGLDSESAAQILALLARLRQARGLGVILISHDLASVRAHADTVQVLHAGRSVETAPAPVFFRAAVHPQSRALLAATLGRAGAARQAAGAVVLSVRDVSVRYQKGFFGGKAEPALRGVSFDLRQGECLGVVGRSGCGKTTLGRAVLQLIGYEGEMALDGAVIGRRGRDRRRIQAVFQDPRHSLNPTMRVGDIIAEPLLLAGVARAARLAAARDLLLHVGLPAGVLDRRADQISGGQAQRVAIARALAAAPDVLVLDEPTSSLDVSTQAGVLTLLRDLAAARGFATILISHDLAVVQAMADRVAFMEGGRISRIGPGLA